MNEHDQEEEEMMVAQLRLERPDLYDSIYLVVRDQSQDLTDLDWYSLSCSLISETDIEPDLAAWLNHKIIRARFRLRRAKYLQRLNRKRPKL